MPNRVVHFEIEAKDGKRATKFYEKAFGWKMLKQGEDYGGYVVVETGKNTGKMEDIGINGGIFTSPKKKFNAYRCVVGVEDIDQAIKKVKAAGGKVFDKNKTPDGKDLGEKMEIPGVGIWALCTDTEGNEFSIMQPFPGEWMPKE